ncbi:hypothetical protein AVEN_114900-1 [Araneus ventricosus]|uniref:Uncharacterized protein n=1 Tax=Araneus ventricosus TaxID=182803 RepID=A0A4Y2EJ61_ARAVE|nr:hypothetical protein AVEN_232254-1 [Araneus ventricosus]GBM29193.1 hypothetical protein AVEN_114900-1 [Araneus ventricosus]
MKHSAEPKLAIAKRREIILTEQYSAALEKVSRKLSAEDESVALYLDGEATEYRDLKTDSETDVEDSPVHEECRDSSSNTNVCIIHPFYL